MRYTPVRALRHLRQVALWPFWVSDSRPVLAPSGGRPPLFTVQRGCTEDRNSGYLKAIRAGESSEATTLSRRRDRCVSGRAPLYLPHVQACHLQADLGKVDISIPQDVGDIGRT